MSDPKPVWDRGDAIDAEMLMFTIGDDWLLDRRLIEHDLRASLAHANGLELVELITRAEAEAIRIGIEAIRGEYRNGTFAVMPSDEDVHSAVERRLIELIGNAGKKLHTGRSRNEQIAVDVRLWLREAIASTRVKLDHALAAAADLAARGASTPLPGYTHLRRAMPSSLGDFAAAHARALADCADGLDLAARSIRFCPLGSGAGYGVPIALDRAFIAEDLGFEGPEEPVTHVQLTRGRAELAYVTALETIALAVGRLAADLWLFTTEEFGFARLPVDLTTGSSMMPQKRNPDVIELIRAHSRQVIAERDALRDVTRDLPSGYHRDFQLLKAPLFRAHDRVAAFLPLVAKLLERIEWNEERMTEAASDPKLGATARALEAAQQGVPFRDAYREESRKTGQGQPPR